MIEIKRTNDYFVRYLFGCEGNEDILLDFINSVRIDSDLEIFSSVEVLNPFNLKERANEKESVLDVKAKAENGETVIIEIQVAGNETFIKRALYYLTHNYSKVISGTDDYSKLKPVISINILNFIIDRETMESHSCYLLIEKNNGQILTDDLEIHFLELKKYINKNLKKDIEIWETFFTTNNLEDTMSTILDKKPIMKKVMDRYKHFTSDNALMTEYDKRVRHALDYTMVMDKEYEKGIEVGIEKGIEVGIGKGEHIKSIEIARNMKSKNIDIKLIAEITGLSREEIEEIQ